MKFTTKKLLLALIVLSAHGATSLNAADGTGADADNTLQCNVNAFCSRVLNQSRIHKGFTSKTFITQAQSASTQDALDSLEKEFTTALAEYQANETADSFSAKQPKRSSDRTPSPLSISPTPSSDSESTDTAAE